MDGTLATTIVSTGGAVIVGCAGLYFHASQTGKRIDDLIRRFERLEDEFRAFKELVNSKFAALDTEIARLMDRGPR
jgi:hypothetical protein